MNRQILSTRCLIANTVEIPPDDVEVIFESECLEDALFQIEYFGYTLVLGCFNADTTKEDVQYMIDELYQSVLGWETDNNGLI